MATISELYHYPVKGCAGVRVRAAVLGFAGLGHDRRFLVTDLAGNHRSQRRDPLLATIQPAVDDDHLTLSAPDAGTIHVPIDPTGPRRPVSLFGSPYTGIDQGSDVAAWLTAVLGKPSRLVLAPPDHHRVTDGLTAGTSYYADSCPVHLISATSLRALNARITANGGHPVPAARFRPNIVVDDWPAHEEDHALRLATGAVDLAYAKPAIRCAVTTVDQPTGTRTGPEPLRTLATYRRTPDGLAFGSKHAVLHPGHLSTGDHLTTTDRSNTDLSGVTETP
ncbi:MOSC N-terminal beta barrel domain-containing protein [Saccharothrix sp. S26]|uniref:MOSC domain-containing protein n=1 Tax=Saccharothrix sp. S26 TaxID=2907215 RepID=UPI001F1C4587|nr:MOSC N-terminal beta barrel domain-containing protein [Saccharothrix sp. S26]MCE6997760.1 MOSC N-terminal beta barrel domain-containing protein [Saccharothrix sp. S26]